MDDIQERLEHYEAKDRERREMEAKIKDNHLNMLIMSKDKNAPEEKFRAVYLQHCEMLRQYRRKYGLDAEDYLRGQLDEANRAYMKQFEAEEQLESQNGQINELKQQITEIDALANAHAYEIIDVKRLILDELYKFPAVDLLGVLLELQQREARKRGQK